MAYGEVAAFQVILRSEEAVSKVGVTVAPLSGPSAIPADRVTLWREHSIATSAGVRPDPLSALQTVDLAAKVTQPVFVEIAVPAEMGYGPKGKGPIPGGATLLFKIELLGIGAS